MRLSMGARMALDFPAMVADGRGHRTGWPFHPAAGVPHASNARGTALPSRWGGACGSRKANGDDTRHPGGSPVHLVPASFAQPSEPPSPFPGRLVFAASLPSDPAADACHTTI